MKYGLLTLLLFTSTFIYSQNEITARTIFENYSLINPAFTGLRGDKISLLANEDICANCYHGNILGERKLKSGNHYFGGAIGLTRHRYEWGRTYDNLEVHLNYAKGFNLKNGNQFRAGLGLNIGNEKYYLSTINAEDTLVNRNLVKTTFGAAYITKNWEYGLSISTINLPGTDFILRKPYYNMEFFIARSRIINPNLKLKSSLAFGLKFNEDFKWSGLSNLQYNLDAEIKDKLTLGVYVGGKSNIGGVSAGYKFSKKFELRANWDALNLLEADRYSRPPLSLNAIFRF